MDTDTLQLLKLVHESDRGVAARLMQVAGIGRQAASARLLKAVKAGLIERTGHGAGVRHVLKTQVDVTKRYGMAGLSEDQVWQVDFSPLLADLPQNVRNIWHHGLTEMINNAIDHSGSKDLAVHVERNALFTRAWVSDAGEGIFLRIQRALGLFDTRHAILELAKGKFTTDPANHSGEGIFFSSKMFDEFEIRSGLLYFSHDGDEIDVLVERPSDAPGTTVSMLLANDSTRTTAEVFDRFALPDEFTFAKTLVPVRLAQHEGEALVSRSQAKRLTLRFEKFQTVVLDFKGVEEIGQGFADEVFRVFQRAHPNTVLMPTEMAPQVKAMVSRALAAAARPAE